jgi:hypothetical protein
MSSTSATADRYRLLALVETMQREDRTETEIVEAVEEATSPVEPTLLPRPESTRPSGARRAA